MFFELLSVIVKFVSDVVCSLSRCKIIKKKQYCKRFFPNRVRIFPKAIKVALSSCRNVPFNR